MKTTGGMAALLTPEEVAEKLNIEVKTVRVWLRTGELTGAKFGRIWRIREEDLKSLIDSKIRNGKGE